MTSIIGNASSLKSVLGDLLEKTDKLSGSELARRLNLPSPTINRLISGQVTDPRTSTLVQIADYFNITVDQLIGREELPESFNLRLPGQRKVVLSHIPMYQLLKGSLIEKADDNRFDYKMDFSCLRPNAFAVSLANVEKFEPVFPKNATLIVDPDSRPDDGDYLLLKIGEQGSVTIRQYTIDGDDKYFMPLKKGLKILDANSVNHNSLGVILEVYTKFKNLGQ